MVASLARVAPSPWTCGALLGVGRGNGRRGGRRAGFACRRGMFFYNGAAGVSLIGDSWFKNITARRPLFQPAGRRRRRRRFLTSRAAASSSRMHASRGRPSCRYNPPSNPAVNNGPTKSAPRIPQTVASNWTCAWRYPSSRRRSREIKIGEHGFYERWGGRGKVRISLIVPNRPAK